MKNTPAKNFLVSASVMFIVSLEMLAGRADAGHIGPDPAPGMSLWLNGDDATDLGGGSIEWPDTGSGKGHVATNNLNAPWNGATFNTVNGHQTIRRFGGFEVIHHSDFDVTDAGGLSMFMVTRIARQSGNLGQFQKGANYTAFDFICQACGGGAGPGDTEHIPSLAGVNTGPDWTVYPDNLKSLGVAEWHVSGGVLTVYFNGTQVGQAAAGALFDATDSDNFWFGSQANNVNTDVDGEIGSVVFYNSALSDTDRNQTGTYLANKYDVTTNYSFIPEPSSFVLLCVGSLGLGPVSRRRRRRPHRSVGRNWSKNTAWGQKTQPTSNSRGLLRLRGLSGHGEGGKNVRDVQTLV